MMFLFILFIHLLNYNSGYSFSLSSHRMKLIVHLINKPELNIYHRKYINRILFFSYEKWAIKKAIEFKHLHYHKCKNIALDDLIISSKLGLYKSIQKYNGQSPFLFFSQIYIKGELFKTLTDFFSINNIPKQIRRTSKHNYTNSQLKEYNTKLNTLFVSHSNFWQFDKYKNSDNNNHLDHFYHLIKIWQFINHFDPLCKIIFNLKYDFEFNTIRSNKQISMLLSCSEENIRKHFHKYKNNIYFKSNITQFIFYTTAPY